MTDITTIGADHLRRAAFVYIRQSSLAQVENNTESTRRQYALVEKALHHAHFAYLMETGRVVAAASSKEIGQGDLLHKVFLGGGEPVTHLETI